VRYPQVGQVGDIVVRIVTDWQLAVVVLQEVRAKLGGGIEHPQHPPQ
jgi:hypothetical protein